MSVFSALLFPLELPAAPTPGRGSLQFTLLSLLVLPPHRQGEGGGPGEVPGRARRTASCPRDSLHLREKRGHLQPVPLARGFLL